MVITNIIGTAVLVLIVGLATWYIVSEKRKGVKCIGCPAGKSQCCSACSTTNLDKIDFASLDSKGAMQAEKLEQ